VSWSPHERTGQPARLDPGRARSGPAAGGSSCQSTCGDSDPPAELLRSGRSSRRIAHDRSGFVGYGPDLEIQTRVEHPTNQSRPTFGYARCGESQQSCAPSAPSSRRSSCRSDVCLRLEARRGVRIPGPWDAAPRPYRSPAATSSSAGAEPLHASPSSTVMAAPRSKLASPLLAKGTYRAYRMPSGATPAARARRTALS
jgi:hypothetical protein